MEFCPNFATMSAIPSSGQKPGRVSRSVDFQDSPETDNVSGKESSLEEKLEVQQTSRVPFLRKLSRLAFSVVLIAIVGYVSYIYTPENERDAMEIVMRAEAKAFRLVKDDAPAITTIPLTSATPQSPFQEVFAVYAPVLTPEGVIDSTINSTGSSETSLIDAAADLTSCTQVLMVHDFAFSFGLPFVGMSWRNPKL